MHLENLTRALAKEPKFRTKQAWQAIFVDLIADWQENTTLPPALRAQLNAECPLALQAELFGSKNSESLKILLELRDGEKVESVLLKHADGRRTVCVSSQVGCPLGCKFCATGSLGFKRDLSSEEIVSQVLFFARYLKKNENEHQWVTNVVFMGMGEPMLNYENVLRAVRILNAPEGLNIGARRISISTSGIYEGIERLAEETIQVNLAVSLHAPDDELRAQLMPIDRRYPLSGLMKAVAAYARKVNREVMFEYMLIKDVNDGIEQARELAQLMQSRLYVVNLIRYNPTGSFQPSGAAAIARFRRILEESGVNVTQRYAFGQDIDAACGQLAGRSKGDHCR
jgi:23S rRNA (adenine2503-C2)-methyltransferase